MKFMKPESTQAKHLKNSFLEPVRRPSSNCTNRGFIALLCIALAVIILTVYMQVGNHQFLNFDDDAYVTNNPHVVSGITGKNIIRAFTSIDEANWHPVTWLSHMADAQLYGMNPRGHHLTSVAIHTISALLLLLLLLRLTDALWQSSFVVALFALHPLHVESVAWVAERKDVLSAMFWFLTLLLYSGYVAKRKTSLYILTFISFVLGLMSKPMLVTLPIIMLLLDFWPIDRIRSEDQEQGLHQITDRITALIKEKFPFFAFAIFSGIITLYAQHRGGALLDLNSVSMGHRIENALLAYVKYIGKTFWPNGLAVYYPFSSNIPLWQAISSLFILLLLSAAAMRAWRRCPYIMVGWFWFLITLAPVIGLIQVGNQSMADRYTYIPVTGLFIMAAWGIPDMARGLRCRKGILALLGAAVIIASTALTWQQLGYWRDNVSLYRHTLQVTTDNKKIHYNLGRALADKGDLNEAILEFREVARISPNDADAYYNLGFALADSGDLDSAILEYRKALQLSPNDMDTLNNLGRALARKMLQNAAEK